MLLELDGEIERLEDEKEVLKNFSLFCLKIYDKMLSNVTQHPEIIIKSVRKFNKFHPQMI